MKRFFTLLFISVVSLSSMHAQRYLTEIFDEVTVTEDVTYGVNATVLFVPVTGEAVPQELKMDIYEPAGDVEEDRPLVLVFHTGNFLPPVTNGQIAGSKSDNSDVEICTQLARRGFVAAAVDYRLGWNPLAEDQPTRALGLIQAAYRGIQDGRTAIRFFRSDAAGEDQFGIDPDRITAWGNGTGGYLVAGLATLDDFLEIVETENGPAKFLLDTNGDGVPETPMVVPTYHGDIEGKVLTIAPDGAFGLPAGDTTNYPNHVDFDSDVTMTVNLGGALGDVSWIDENTVPMVTVHSPNDLFAPYDDAVLIVPTTGDDIVRVQGGLGFQPVLNDVGANDVFTAAAIDDEATDMAIANSATAGHDYFEALYPFIREPNSNGLDEGVVINWWDPSALSPPILPDFPNGVPWNALPHPSGGTFNDQGLVLNEGMSPEKARANIAEIMAYVVPRLCEGMTLGCMESSTTEVLDASVFTIAPNPATDVLNIQTDGMNIQSITIFGLDGKTYAQQEVNSQSATIYRNNLPAGIYLIKALFEEGVATQRVVFR